jgi:hypothetical protein
VSREGQAHRDAPALLDRVSREIFAARRKWHDREREIEREREGHGTWEREALTPLFVHVLCVVLYVSIHARLTIVPIMGAPA